ncbi:MAG: preprotein translocase subunit SecG [Clostridia bacterium]|nr:preprotein translocase subunit SecG [Clostridia bacterium]MBR2969131.1 preprotein translocase subunit SecG [Clostridia bacterium]
MVLSIICVALIVLCSLFVIIVVLMQKTNSDGISAITGSSETFYGKNKSKTLDSKLKRLTVICLIIIGVLCVLYLALGLFF